MSLSKKRRDPPIQIKGVIIFFLVVIVLCVYTFYFLAPPPAKKKPEYMPAPKAKRPPTSKVKDYTSSCRRVNQRTLLFLKSLGGTEKDFRILHERSGYNKKKRWFHTEAEIYIPRNVELSTAVKDLVEKLKGFSGLSSKWDTKGAHQVFLSVWLDEVLSHSFLLLHRPPQLAIIIDDIGEDLKQTQKFLDLGIPLTLAILPDQSHSQESEALAHNRGYEVMLHLPMEPKNRLHHNPGKGAITIGMDENKVIEIVRGHINKFSFIKGVNNHMGSRVTEDEKTMRAVFKALKPTRLHFVDSQTSSQSKAYSLAREMGVPSGKNLIFIDNEPEVNYSKNFIDKAIKLVKKRGHGIIIGHPRETTLEALKEMIPQLKAEGISLVFVSALVQ